MALSVRVHPQTAKDYGIPETYVAEINLDAIEEALQPAQPFTEISKFPAVSCDIALLLSSDVKHQDVLDAIGLRVSNVDQGDPL